MTPERWQQVERAYSLVAGADPLTRGARLDEVCAGDEELRHEVASLLAQESGAPAFLSTPALDVAARSLAFDGPSLHAGDCFGRYEIVASIGAGGMGEVFRARDTQLGRDVALKVLPPMFLSDPDRRRRFEREARVLAALSHPHIAGIHGFETYREVHALILELVDGPTLATRLKRGALPRHEALKIAAQVAAALSAAHEKQIVHRDVKPANIALGRDGTVKVLDFGLARPEPHASESEAESGAGDRTKAGDILGTTGYMSPEQARGQSIDRRCDLWAFGCVLYEMLAGRPAFSGDTPSDTMAAILNHDPDWTSLPHDTPPRVQLLLQRCLRKDPAHRLRDAADAQIEIEETLQVPGGPAREGPAPSARPLRQAAAIGLLLLASASVAVRHWRQSGPAAEPMTFGIAPEENSQFGPIQFAVSPDGRDVVFVARTEQGPPTLWVRPLAMSNARALPGTEGASMPFWAADGRHIGFFAGGKLKKVPASGGPSTILCDAQANRLLGGTWSRDNVIVFTPSPSSALHRIDAAGGIPSPMTSLAQGETAHRFPSFLPDGRHVIYLAARGMGRELRVAALDSAETRALGAASDSQALYASGYLLFSRENRLLAQRFDPATLRLSGDPLGVADVEVGITGRGYFSASDTGVLTCWHHASLPRSQLTWFDRRGQMQGVVGAPGSYAVYHNVSLSPDERHIAVSKTTGSPENRDIWLIDLKRANIDFRLTSDASAEADPVWSPDGSQIIYNSDREGGEFPNAFRRAADGSGHEIRVVRMERLIDSPDWSHDGRWLVFTGGDSRSFDDLWVLSLSGREEPKVFLQSSYNKDSPAFSPDDRWVAYDSEKSGRFEVYVRPFAGEGPEVQVSRDGGWAPRWRGDGRELYFLGLDGTMMTATVSFDRMLHAQPPRALFKTPLLRDGFTRHPYAVTHDGQRFLVPMPDRRQASTPITVVINWPALVTSHSP